MRLWYGLLSAQLQWSAFLCNGTRQWASAVGLYKKPLWYVGLASNLRRSDSDGAIGPSASRGLLLSTGLGLEALVSSEQAILEVHLYVLGHARRTADDVRRDGSSDLTDFGLRQHKQEAL